MNQKQHKWCAWCGLWGDHTSGSCADLKNHLRKKHENQIKQAQAKILKERIPNAKPESL